jgi:dipeptidyl aminopeptidase/acylaminoacyl peptidase
LTPTASSSGNGYLDKHRDVLIQLSPATHVEKIEAPLMIIHGANDIRVPVYEAEQLAQRLKELGREVKMIILPAAFTVSSHLATSL